MYLLITFPLLPLDYVGLSSWGCRAALVRFVALGIYVWFAVGLHLLGFCCWALIYLGVLFAFPHMLVLFGF